MEATNTNTFSLAIVHYCKRRELRTKMKLSLADGEKIINYLCGRCCRSWRQSPRRGGECDAGDEWRPDPVCLTFGLNTFLISIPSARVKAARSPACWRPTPGCRRHHLRLRRYTGSIILQLRAQMISITNTINYCISYFNYTITIFSIRYISIILQLQLLQLCQTSDPAQACRELYGATAAAAEE